MNDVIAAKKSPEVIEYLSKRRSVLARNMQDPGPTEDEIQQMLTIAARVPDHGKLSPFYFKILKGESRTELGKLLRESYLEEDPKASEAKLDLEAARFERSPLVIVVVSSVKLGKIPEWEQVLCAGAVCQNLVIVANAFGYGAQWLTEWYAFNKSFKQGLGLEAEEKIAGFIYIGTPIEEPSERQRPDISDLIK